jgi:23S rRNA A2030 N6-methylase RlmJ
VLAAGVSKAMSVGIKVAAPEGKLDRAGLLVTNPPYGFETQVREAASLVAPRLDGTITLSWLAGEE